MNRNKANDLLLEKDRLQRDIADLEAEAKEHIAFIREDLKADTAKQRARLKKITQMLQRFYSDHKPNDGSRRIRLQDGIVGYERRPRVEVPKSAVDQLPPRALSVRKKANKNVVKKLPADLLESLNIKTIRPSMFYARVTLEDADR